MNVAKYKIKSTRFQDFIVYKKFDPQISRNFFTVSKTCRHLNVLSDDLIRFHKSLCIFRWRLNYSSFYIEKRQKKDLDHLKICLKQSPSVLDKKWISHVDTKNIKCFNKSIGWGKNIDTDGIWLNFMLETVGEGGFDEISHFWKNDLEQRQGQLVHFDFQRQTKETLKTFTQAAFLPSNECHVSASASVIYRLFELDFIDMSTVVRFHETGCLRALEPILFPENTRETRAEFFNTLWSVSRLDKWTSEEAIIIFSWESVCRLHEVTN